MLAVSDEMYLLMQRWMKRGHATDVKKGGDRRAYLALALVFPRTEQTGGRAE